MIELFVFVHVETPVWNAHHVFPNCGHNMSLSSSVVSMYGYARHEYNLQHKQTSSPHSQGLSLDSSYPFKNDLRIISLVSTRKIHNPSFPTLEEFTRERTSSVPDPGSSVWRNSDMLSLKLKPAIDWPKRSKNEKNVRSHILEQKWFRYDYG